MISIINYGLGNINAICSAYKSIGVDYQIIDKGIDLKDATHVILPGVGSFDNAMNKINNNDFNEILNFLVLEKKIFILGICVGLQIMSNSSSEGKIKGFGWIDVETKMIDLKDIKLKIPHMGWNKIKAINNCPILKDVDDEEFYFLHSFNISDVNNKYTSATSTYGLPITAAISYKNIFGTQFHPEKSHHQGLKILKNFSDLK
jgi:glutamine amidotransferase